jgi:hypothetical protein
MRYVFGICAVTVFLAWDGFYHDWDHFEFAIREVQRVLQAFGL